MAIRPYAQWQQSSSPWRQWVDCEEQPFDAELMRMLMEEEGVPYEAACDLEQEIASHCDAEDTWQLTGRILTCLVKHRCSLRGRTTLQLASDTQAMAIIADAEANKEIE